jgi:hypothetical protein
LDGEEDDFRIGGLLLRRGVKFLAKTLEFFEREDGSSTVRRSEASSSVSSMPRR